MIPEKIPDPNKSLNFSARQSNQDEELGKTWNDLKKKYNVFVIGFQVDTGKISSGLLSATSELITHCKQKGIPISPNLLKDMPKGPSWLRVIAKLHFSGMNVTGFKASDLGLDGSGEICDEHRVYLEIIEKLQTFPDIRNKESFDEFLSWLVSLDFVENKSNINVIESVPGWQKSMQPELCHLATNEDKCFREGFDPNWYEKELLLYKIRHSFMKQQILEAFIEEAPKAFVYDLFKKWLFDRGICEWLFKQHYYPLNMMTSEYCEWNLLLYGLKKILPETGGDIATSFKECTGFNQPVEDLSEKQLPPTLQASNAFGRTLLILTRSEENKYLKVQSKTETDLEFRRGYERLKRVLELKDVLDLQSFVPEPKKLMRVSNPHILVEARTVSTPARDVFKKKVENKPCLAMEFSTPNDIPYDEYIYDVTEDTSAMEALHKYAKDYGKLWRHELLPPPCLSAFHDVDDKRKHVMLAPFANLKCEGSIEQWQGQATEFPNIGGPQMGMRDKVDILLPEEKSQHYFSGKTIDTECLEDRNKIRMEELSKAAQGLCLQYARRFNNRFNHKSQKSVETIKNDVGGLLLDLFSSAFPLSVDECRTLMEEHDLLNQCSREISYWLSEDACYVSDLRKAKINRDVYPHLPYSMQGCVLTPKQDECLKEYGFVDISKSYDGASCQLGAQSGRMPLIALNALVVKILAYGTLRNAQMEQQVMIVDAKKVYGEQLVA